MGGRAVWAATRLQARVHQEPNRTALALGREPGPHLVGATMGATSGVVDDDDGTAMAGTSVTLRGIMARFPT